MTFTILISTNILFRITQIFPSKTEAFSTAPLFFCALGRITLMVHSLQCRFILHYLQIHAVPAHALVSKPLPHFQVFLRAVPHSSYRHSLLVPGIRTWTSSWGGDTIPLTTLTISYPVSCLVPGLLLVIHKHLLKERKKCFWTSFQSFLSILFLSEGLTTGLTPQG